MIRKSDLDVIYIAGPGHGGPGMVANTYLEGTYSELYPGITQDAGGMARLFRQFSFPGGIPSHVAPETPGSIHEGGELGYSLVHAYGAAFDNPDLIVACVIGDGEAETGPLAGSWHSSKFLNPAQDGAVLPILHLNGYKIANPTVLARIPADELSSLLRGYGYTVYTVEGDDPKLVHQQLAATMDAVIGEIRAIQRRAREDDDVNQQAWRAIVLRTPKGWTGPKVVDGLPVEGTWRAHQVPIANARTNPEHLAQLEAWLRSYRAEELFDGSGALVPELAALAPRGGRRMGANPHANGGLQLRDLRCDSGTTPWRQHPGEGMSEATRVLGGWLRDVIKANPSNFGRRPSPAVVLKTPKGWTGPKSGGRAAVEGTWRAHQVPIAEVRGNPEHLAQLESWMRSYRAEELRRRGHAGTRAGGAGPARRAADEREPARQRRLAPA